MNRNYSFANGRKFAIITATQERFGAFNSASNIAGTIRLQQALNEHGCTFQQVEGWYNGVDQGPSFLVWDAEPEWASMLAEDFGQESIVTDKGLLFTDGKLLPAVRYIVGDEAIATGNYTKHADTGLCWAFILADEPFILPTC